VSRLLPLAGAALGGALVVALFLALAGGGDEPSAARAATPTYTSPGKGFSIATPRGWKAVADGKAATVLRRGDDRGVVVVHERPALAGSLDELAAGLRRSLSRKLPGAREAAVRKVAVGGAEGLVYTFVRPATGQVQSVVVAPAGDRSYTLDLVADGDAPDVARELASMVRSFAPAAR
jgi:hypothetical protein